MRSEKVDRASPLSAGRTDSSRGELDAISAAKPHLF